MIIPNELLSIVSRRRIIAEVRTETAKQALSAIEALARGGIGVFSISITIPGSEELLRHYSGNPTILVGSGGVLDERQAKLAIDSGASFVISPIVATEIVPLCAERHVTCILGAMTPTEIIHAQRAGADMVNLFPISAIGGSNYLRSLYRHFAALNLMISGGITMDNIGDYLPLPVFGLGLSSAITPRDLVERGEWARLTAIARQLTTIVGEPAAPDSPLRDPHVPLLDTSRAPRYGEMVPPPHQSGAGLLSRAAGSRPSEPPPAAARPFVAPSTPPNAPDDPKFHPWDSKPVGDDWIN